MLTLQKTGLVLEEGMGGREEEEGKGKNGGETKGEEKKREREAEGREEEGRERKSVNILINKVVCQ